MDNRADHIRLIAIQRPVKHYYGMLERNYRANREKVEFFFVGRSIGQEGNLPIVRNYFNVLEFFSMSREMNDPQAASLMLFELGQFVEAEQAFRALIDRQRGNADAWNMLGITLLRQQKFSEAIEALEMAVEVAPRSPEALNNLGNAYKESHEPAKAARYYRRALALSADFVMAHANLANCLVELGELAQAEQHAHRAIELNPQSFEGWSALACTEERRGDYVRAIEVLKKALDVFPDQADWLLQLGSTYILAKQHDAAIDVLQRALQCRPQFVEAMSNLGKALFEAGRLEEAERVLKEAIALRPTMCPLHVNLANVYVAMKQHVAAQACFDEVFRLDPENASAHFVLGMVLLVEGDFDRGWCEYNYRWQIDTYKEGLKRLNAPQWCGEDLHGKTLLVHAEQGIGDSLHFCRYLALAKVRGARVIFECQPAIKRLMSSVRGCDVLIARGDALPDFDMHVPLLNLPAVLGTRFETIPAAVPYLQADDEAKLMWINRLAQLGGDMKVGIVWAGNPEHANDHNRSMRLAQLAPLASVSGICWVSLQKGGRVETQSGDIQFDMVDWADELADFSDTAALVDALDLVIAVDTSVAHLAGGLNKPVWVMVPFAPDWRWLLDRTDSPWYPSMRLFRQAVRGDWASVVADVVQALHELTKH